MQLKMTNFLTGIVVSFSYNRFFFLGRPRVLYSYSNCTQQQKPHASLSRICVVIYNTYMATINA